MEIRTASGNFELQIHSGDFHHARSTVGTACFHILYVRGRADYLNTLLFYDLEISLYSSITDLMISSLNSYSMV